jgi:hypothetical protein
VLRCEDQDFEGRANIAESVTCAFLKHPVEQKKGDMLGER